VGENPIGHSREKADPTKEPVWDAQWARPDLPADALISPCSHLSGSIQAQPSKNYTTRLLLAAGLGSGVRTVDGLATSDDAEAMIRVLRCLGAEIQVKDQADSHGRPSRRQAIIGGIAGKPVLSSEAATTGVIDVGNAGAVLRLALGIASLLPEVQVITHHLDSLGKRPNADLLEALQSLGVTVESGPEGRLPIKMRRSAQSPIGPLEVQVSGRKSSQFLSSLLFLAPLLGQPVTIRVTGGELVSKPAVQQTLEILTQSGISVSVHDDMTTYQVEAGSYDLSETSSVNGDWPGSAAIIAAGAILPGSVQILGLRYDSQGEKASQQVTAAYGARVDPIMSYRPAFAQTGLHITGGQPLTALNFDGDPLTDAVLAMLAPACFASGTTRIHNVHNLRIKECDRISEPLRELRKLGVVCHEGHEIGDEDPDSIHITGNPDGYEGGVVLDGRGDHRVVMLLSVVGMRTRRGVRITGAHHVAKSYPGFFRDLAQLGAEVELIPSESVSSSS
jgi:3-phosphoshikimate 1-carboxyvinyltransferase